MESVTIMTKMIRAGFQIKCNGKPEKEIALKMKLKMKQIKSQVHFCKSLMIVGVEEGGRVFYFFECTISSWLIPWKIRGPKLFINLDIWNEYLGGILIRRTFCDSDDISLYNFRTIS